MLFNSIDFVIFLPIVYLLFWLSSRINLRFQNLTIVIASYFFYGWWDWRFLSLILFSTIIDYTVGRLLKKENHAGKRKFYLLVSIVVNLGFLGVFKYYNFFLDNFIDVFSFFGFEIRASSLKVILPVGISFYTFQTLSYSIDVYKKKLEPTNDFIAFAAFVSFFPQLVAGPIERATNLLPQFYSKRQFDYQKSVDGIRQILWGLFKKVVIADNCAEYANVIFNNSDAFSGSTLLLGAIFFTFQIYGDFSGYSDIAIGVARLFGFSLKQNFAFPYFSRDIAEFWRRWHISLSTWFRDYLYIPLGGSKGGTMMKIRNTFIIFIVSGFWHGANWTFIVWGALNAVYFLPLLLLKRNRTNMEVAAMGRLFPSIREFLQIATTFILTILAWIFFRAENIAHAMEIFSKIFSKSLFAIPEGVSLKMIILFFILVIFLFAEWLQREKQHALELDAVKIPSLLRYSIYFLILISILWLGGSNQTFIYFQF